jgi:hypothetical protein
MRAPPRLVALAASVLLAWSPSLAAQTTDATVVVTVRSARDQALPGAMVELRNDATGFTVRGLTGRDGRATFRQLPLGGPYAVTASRIGAAPARRTGYALGLGSRVEVTMRLSDRSVQLEAVVVDGAGGFARDVRLGGSTRIGGERHPVPRGIVVSPTGRDEGDAGRYSGRRFSMR